MSAERGEPIRAEQCDSVRVCLDGGWLEVGVGETILQAAERAGREIPTLCFDRRLAPFGACRLCLVGVQGAGAPLPACTTRCHDGMVVDTTDERARRVVRTVLELVLSELPGDPLPVCRAHARAPPRRAPSLPAVGERAVHLLRALRSHLRRAAGGLCADGHRPGL